jgi:hypothetical protein
MSDARAIDPDRAVQAAVAADLHRRVEQSRTHNLLLTPAGRREAEARAREAERERRAALPPPRQVLREAHSERAAAQSDADRLTGAAARASEHLAAIAAERGELATAIEQAEALAARQLIEDLNAGRTTGAVPSPGGEKRIALADAEHRLNVAQRAADAVGGELAAAQQRLAAANRHVREAVAALLIEVARNEAEAILADVDALDRRRAALDQLGIEITNLQRQLGPAARAPWPQSIHEALNPELRAPPGLPSRHAGAAPEAARHWADVRQALLDDAEACAELGGTASSSGGESETVAAVVPAA